jgi:hypothetical protein
VGVGLSFAVGESEPELEDAAIEIVQLKEQFAHRSGVIKGCVQLIVGPKVVKGRAIDKLQRPRPLVGE